MALLIFNLRNLKCFKFFYILVIFFGVALFISFYWNWDAVDQMTEVEISGTKIKYFRDKFGVMHFFGENTTDFAKGLGYFHAQDRGVQMVFTSVISQGRLSELIMDDDHTRLLDIWIKSLQMVDIVDEMMKQLHNYPEVVRLIEAYNEGVNAYFSTHSRPLEFLLVNYHPEPWNLKDVLITCQFLGHFGITDTSEWAEKFVVESFQLSEQSGEFIKQLFHPFLEHIDESLLSILKQVQVYDPIIPPEALVAVPSMRASNNWVISPKRSKSGSALFSNDPHLQVNRLPPMFYEVVFNSKDNYLIGGTLPGTPIALMGTTKYISFGATFGNMDMVDYFIEEVKGGKVRRGDSFVPVQARNDSLRIKGDNPVPLYFYKTDRGYLNSDPTVPLKDGFYLVKKNPFQIPPLIDKRLEMLNAKSVVEAQQLLRYCDVSLNFVMSDSQGNIGFQQSGVKPVRKFSGLIPLPAWDNDTDWTSFLPIDQFTHFINPESGFIVSTNDNWNSPSNPNATNLHMGSYRSDRFKELMDQYPKVGKEEMKLFQRDTLSHQARRFMKVLSPLIPKNITLGKHLRDWNYKYERNSTGAVIFERFYEALLDAIFDKFYGNNIFYHTKGETIMIIYFHYFDNLVLDTSPTNILWKEETQSNFFQRILTKVLTGMTQEQEATNSKTPITYADVNKAMWNNIFFDGILPQVLGFDHGPFSVEGSRATLHQGQMFRHEKIHQNIIAAPAARLIRDHSENKAYTSLPGGNSGRRFSQFYVSDMHNWLNYKYKELDPYYLPEDKEL